MKKLIFFVFFVMISASVSAQERDPFYSSFSFGSGVNKPLGNTVEFSSVEMDYEFGFNFNQRVAAFADLGAAVNLFENDDAKDFYRVGTLGLGAGYNIIANDTNTLQIRGSLGYTIFPDGDRKYTYYEGGLRYSNKEYLGRAILGLGVKYYDSNNDIFKNYTTLKGSLSFYF